MCQARGAILAIFEPMILKPLLGWIKANKLASWIIAILAVLLMLTWWPSPALDSGIRGVAPEFGGGIGGFFRNHFARGVPGGDGGRARSERKA